MSLYIYLIILIFIFFCLIIPGIQYMQNHLAERRLQKEIAAFIKNNNIVPKQNDIEPPWIYGFGSSPYDVFWRQAGEFWIFEVWIPFWKSLDSTAQSEYLARWHVPQQWHDYLDSPLILDPPEAISIAGFVINEHIKREIIEQVVKKN